MGVKSLWQLLEPVGKRINIEALQGKKLAIGASLMHGTPHSSKGGFCAAAALYQRFRSRLADASIWLNQFVKAMRDDQGELIRNAHLLGFFRRICRRVRHPLPFLPSLLFVLSI
jgi:DNA excision repair protein ERCC-5